MRTGRCGTPWKFRHDGFATPEFISLLREHGIALVVPDTAGQWPLIEDVTADFMDRWAKRIRARARRWRLGGR